jgi:hypothetical protein
MAPRDHRDTLGPDAANPSGAPDAGGATTPHSAFGGRSFIASALRFLARIARNLEATAYRRLREMELKRNAGRTSSEPGAPRRTREAARKTAEGQRREEPRPPTPPNGQPAF